MTADTYVEVFFNSQSSKTKVFMDSLSPVWNEYMNLYFEN